MCEIQQAGLLRFDFELVTSVNQVCLDAASNGAKPGDQPSE
jgi:hypothetical protein